MVSKKDNSQISKMVLKVTLILLTGRQARLLRAHGFGREVTYQTLE